MFYSVFPTENGKEWDKKKKTVCMNIQFYLMLYYYKLSMYSLYEWIIYPNMKVDRD